MKNMSVKTGDKVVVLTGKDGGKVAEVIAAFPKTSRVQVKGVNLMTRHKKPKNAREKGGIFRIESTIDVSNVQIICPHCNKATRVANTTDENGNKHRTCKKCGASLDGGRRAAKKAEVKETEVKTAAPKAEQPKKATMRDAQRKGGNVKTTNSAKQATVTTRMKTITSSGK